MLSTWLFALTVLGYLAGAGAYILYFYRREWERRAVVVSWAAWGLHGAALAALLAEVRHPPIYSSFEAILFLAWLIMLHYLVIDLIFSVRVAGVFLLPVLAGLLVYAATLPRPAEPAATPVNYWILVHAVLALGGYGAFALAFVASLMYLLQERQLRAKAFALVYHRLPPLDTLDSLSFKFILYGFPLLTLAIITGSIWAGRIWQKPWFAEPKGWWTVLIWAVYAAYLLLRVRAGWGGRRAAYLVVFGFVAVVFNLVVVNLWLTREHMF